MNSVRVYFPLSVRKLAVLQQLGNVPVYASITFLTVQQLQKKPQRFSPKEKVRISHGEIPNPPQVTTSPSKPHIRDPSQGRPEFSQQPHTHHHQMGPKLLLSIAPCNKLCTNCIQKDTFFCNKKGYGPI